jgi:hypothetical protein
MLDNRAVVVLAGRQLEVGEEAQQAQQAQQVAQQVVSQLGLASR